MAGRLTERAAAAIHLGYEDAERRGQSWFGPANLLWGVLQDPKAVAVAMLEAVGVERAVLQARLDGLLGADHGGGAEQLQLSPGTRRALELAYAEASQRSCKYVGTEHLLVGVAMEGGNAAELLASLGATVDRLRAALDALETRTAPGSAAPYEEVKGWMDGDMQSLRGRSILSMADLTPEQLQGILQKAEEFRQARLEARTLVDWKGRKSLALLFEKASLRTRVTFELGMRELGGVPIVLGPAEVGLGKRESVGDVARNLDRWVTAVAARVFDHNTLLELHRCSSIPIINALSDIEHPCQTLADLQALQQRKGRLDGLRIAWVGDGNNVLHSLMLGAAMLGASVIAACPAGYEPDPKIVSVARERARGGATIEIVNDPEQAVAGADAVYTDVWVSMGAEAEAEQRRAVFAAFRVTPDLMSQAAPNAVFMHCLPAHRGEEVTDAVLDGPASIVLDQAENRLHAQKALLALLLGP